jgi:hypothetical protein
MAYFGSGTHLPTGKDYLHLNLHNEKDLPFTHQSGSYFNGLFPVLPAGWHYFFHQAQIDSYQVDYPGCTEIEGSVVGSRRSVFIQILFMNQLLSCMIYKALQMSA